MFDIFFFLRAGGSLSIGGCCLSQAIKKESREIQDRQAVILVFCTNFCKYLWSSLVPGSGMLMLGSIEVSAVPTGALSAPAEG